MGEENIVGQTTSVCPICLKVIEAWKVAEDDGIYMKKNCPLHGDFQVLIWQGSVTSYLDWARKKPEAVAHPSIHEVDQGCPYDCGLCPEHRQEICCVLLEVTNRCNLHCPVCFASAGGEKRGEDPSLAEIGKWYDQLLAQGGPFNIQLSGGEPTMRDDLGDIIALGRAKGFTFFQLNTNGLRLATDPSYAQALREAGLNCVFLQFDGLREGPYEVLRGRPLLQEKLQAIMHCEQAGLGVVLVPTLALGVNMDQLGEIIQFALDHLPHIRGVHFQPLSYFGRCDIKPEERLTLPGVLSAIEHQSQGKIKAEDFAGGGAENAYCSFHGNFMRLAKGEIKAVKSQDQGCCQASSKQSQEFVAKRWSGITIEPACSCGEALSGCETQSLDVFLEKIQRETLAISGMLFQDAWNLDLDRLKQCYIGEVAPDGRIIPFCAYNLTNSDGEALYRGRK